MAVTPFQSDILKLLARNRRARGESYVAGGVALNLLLDGARRSRDIDLFHDTETALRESFRMDRERLLSAGYQLDLLRDEPWFVEARVSLDSESTELQWARDSAFRFFPLIEDERMGLALHPFDLATNKTLAMAGRLEVRDWVDLLKADESLQPLGLLVWAACGKDPGFNPVSLLALIKRHRYCQPELDKLDFEGPPPSAAQLGRRWLEMREAAGPLIDALPAEHAGECVLTDGGELFRGDAQQLSDALANNRLLFHPGRICGSWPQLRPETR
jgi:hypothetical protein